RYGQQQTPYRIAHHGRFSLAAGAIRRCAERLPMARVVAPRTTRSVNAAPTTGTNSNPWPENPKAWNTPGAFGDDPITGNISSVLASKPDQTRTMRTSRTRGNKSVAARAPLANTPIRAVDVSRSRSGTPCRPPPITNVP